MKPFPLFITFVLGLLFISNGLADTLKQSLRGQLDDVNKSEASLVYRIPCASQRMHYTVSAALASIFESHTEAELVPMLTALKSSVDANDALLVQDWIAIVKSHVLGTPGTVVGLASGSSAKSVPVVCYSVPLFSHHP